MDEEKARLFISAEFASNDFSTKIHRSIVVNIHKILSH